MHRSVLTCAVAVVAGMLTGSAVAEEQAGKPHDKQAEAAVQPTTQPSSPTAAGNQADVGSTGGMKSDTSRDMNPTGTAGTPSGGLASLGLPAGAEAAASTDSPTEQRSGQATGADAARADVKIDRSDEAQPAAARTDAKAEGEATSGDEPKTEGQIGSDKPHLQVDNPDKPHLSDKHQGEPRQDSPQR